MKISPTMGSLFDGSGGFPLGGLLHGIEPVWASEVEPYPIAVTKLHFPNMKHLGNISKIHGGEIDPVDVVTFGSPCQDMSIAGKRAGLLHTAKGDDTTTRSGLFYEAIRIMKEMRDATHGKYPSFAVWENVPGALTSAKGEDFRCVLQELLQISEEGDLSIPRPANGKWLHTGEILADHCSIAWRILDAQYWGVPQRRKRIYLVADFGGQRAGEILFERESMRGYFAQSGKARQRTADDAAGGAGGSCEVRCLNPWDHQSIRQYDTSGIFPALSANSGGGQNRSGICFSQNQRDEVRDLGDKSGSLAAEQGMHQQSFIALKCLNPWDCQSKRVYLPGGVYPTLPAMDCGRANNQAVIYEPCSALDENWKKNHVKNSLRANSSRSSHAVVEHVSRKGTRPHSVEEAQKWEVAEVANTLNTFDQGEARANEFVVERCPVFCTGNGQLHQMDLGDKAGALNCMHDQQAIIHNAKPPRKYIVRRLTPLECNRLQGFPDYWGFVPHKDAMTDEEYQFWTNVRNTHIAINGKTPKPFTKKAMLDWYNKLHTDSAEYKMWGNGVAEPCVCFVMDGIARAMAEQWCGPCNIGKE